MKICKHCGLPEDEHHEPDWLEIPDGCVCDWREWNYRDKTKLPDICDRYDGDGQQSCKRCEHDKECHR